MSSITKFARLSAAISRRASAATAALLGLLACAAAPAQYMYIYGTHKPPGVADTLRKCVFNGTTLTTVSTWTMPVRGTVASGVFQNAGEIDVEGRFVYLHYTSHGLFGPAELRTYQENATGYTLVNTWVLPTVTPPLGQTHNALDFAVDGNEVLLFFRPLGAPSEVRRYDLNTHAYLGSIFPPLVLGSAPDEIEADNGVLHALHKPTGSPYQINRMTMPAGAWTTSTAPYAPGTSTNPQGLHGYLGNTMVTIHFPPTGTVLVGHNVTPGGLVPTTAGIPSPTIPLAGINYSMVEIAIDAGYVPATIVPYGSGCSGSNGLVPLLSSTGSPIIGTTISVNLSGALANTTAVLALGVGATSVSLAPNGAPGCWILTTQETLIPLFTSPTGTVSVPYAIPPAPVLLGTSLYAQMGINDATANAADWVTTRGLQVFYGNG